MPGRECYSLVVEEQDRVVARLPLRMVPVLVLERAGDPGLAREGADDFGALVQDAAIAHPRAAELNGHDVAERRNPIAHRHVVTVLPHPTGFSNLLGARPALIDCRARWIRCADGPVERGEVVRPRI